METIDHEPGWLDSSLYPFRRQYFATEHGRMHYVDEGQGRPILFVHGTPSWSFEWRNAISRLSRQARCIAPDHLGFGLSDKPETAPYKPSDHKRRLLELVQKLDLRDLTLVVHDFGGPIGLPLALEQPERVRDVVVINTWMWANPEPRVRRLSSFVASPLGRFLYKWLNASPRWLLPASFADKRRLSSEVHRHYLAPFASRHLRQAPWVLGCELWGSNDYYAQLWSQRTRLGSLPLTVLWGMKDPAIGVDQLERWREAFPAARIVELADVGHFPQEEADLTSLIAA